MKKTIWIILVILILAVIAVIIGSSKPVTEVVPEEDTTMAIEQQLESLDLGDLESEFQEIDTALEQL